MMCHAPAGGLELTTISMVTTVQAPQGLDRNRRARDGQAWRPVRCRDNGYLCRLRILLDGQLCLLRIMAEDQVNGGALPWELFRAPEQQPQTNNAARLPAIHQRRRESRSGLIRLLLTRFLGSLRPRLLQLVGGNHLIVRRRTVLGSPFHLRMPRACQTGNFPPMRLRAKICLAKANVLTGGKALRRAARLAEECMRRAARFYGIRLRLTILQRL